MNPVPPSKDDHAGSDDFTFQPLRPAPTGKTAPCQRNCPCGTSVRDWIAPIAQRESTGLSTEAAYELSWQRIVENNPFPATMGRICPHPCEDQCSRVDKDGAVAVSALERFLGDWALERGLSLPRHNYQPHEESVGVVGAGPAGLSYAYQMARRGYQVSVYDWHPHAGGMLRYGVPEYRLPRKVLDAEIARITDLGVELTTGTRIGQDLPLTEIRRRHDILFLGLGAQQGQLLKVPGENGPGVWVGTDFLARYNEGHPLLQDGQLLVIGGGNTAIDVARIGRRSGAEVRILYRRELADMPAIRSEIRQAQDEGVEIDCLVAPVELLRDPAGNLQGVQVQRMQPGAVDASGRPKPIPIPGAYYNQAATAVVVAVSQQADWSGLEALQAQVSTPTDDSAGKQALGFGGDLLSLGIASHAIAQGKLAAERACLEYSADQEPAAAGVPQKPPVKPGYYPETARLSQEETPVEFRLRVADAEIFHTVDENMFLEEAQRCMSCGSCLGCQLCWMYCNAGSFIPLENPGPGGYFSFDPTICEGCGKCIELCPSGFMTPE
jgi:dissimilatory sulfite reductase flavoprotein subunit